MVWEHSLVVAILKETTRLAHKYFGGSSISRRLTHITKRWHITTSGSLYLYSRLQNGGAG
jgi:hypothetical protein